MEALNANPYLSKRSKREIRAVLRKRGLYKFQPFVIRRLAPKSNAIPMGRSGHRIVSDNACVYSFGGFNPEADGAVGVIGGDLHSKLFKELWKFNIARQTWERLDYFSPSMPQQLASNAVVLEGHHLFVHGGTGIPFGLSNTNHTYITSLRSGTEFRDIPVRGMGPMPKYGQAMVLDRDRLYVVGGSTGLDYLLDVHCLDLKNMVWDQLFLTTPVEEDDPCGRYRHEIALVDSKILVFGGGTNLDVFAFFDIPAFDLRTRTWDMIPTFRCNRRSDCLRQWFPPPRRCHGLAFIPGDERRDPEVVICGGFDGIEVLSDVWRLNLRTFDWILCDCSLPDPVYFHSACVSPNGQMFVFGGIRELMANRHIITSRRNQVYTMWATIPTLKEMCWEAVRHYIPKMARYRTSYLLRCGIPMEFIERLEKR